MVSGSFWSMLVAGDFPVNYDTHADKVALIGMFSALGVALIGGVFSYITRTGSTPVIRGKVAKECAAWERWLLLHGFDPRLIKTGYEEEKTVLVVNPDDEP